MGFFTNLLIALALAMDCFAVSLGLGFKNCKNSLSFSLKLGFLFGGFQVGMFFLAWYFAKLFRDYLVGYHYILAFLILTLVGLKMIYESKKPCSHKETKNTVLVILAFATSIDAFSVGLGFAMLDFNLLQLLFLIGLSSFMLSFVGLKIGYRLGLWVGYRAELLGGLVLILIAIKILLENLK